MERRHFLGALASIPLLRGFISQVKTDDDQYYTPNCIDRNQESISCSGWDHTVINGNGTYRI